MGTGRGQMGRDLGEGARGLAGVVVMGLWGDVICQGPGGEGGEELGAGMIKNWER